MRTIDHVASAMAEQALREMGQPELLHDPDYIGRIELAGVNLRVLAEAALVALRDTPIPVRRFNGSAHWPQMIDAIIREPSTASPPPPPSSHET